MRDEVEKLLVWLQLLQAEMAQADIALQEIRSMEKDHLNARAVVEKRYVAVHALLDSVMEDPATPPWLQERVRQRVRAIQAGTAAEHKGEPAQEEALPGEDWGMFRRAHREG